MTTLALPFEVKSPLVVCCGVGRNSVAMLVGLKQRGIRPDLITFANTGSERPETLAYLHDVLNPWLERIGFPTVTEVCYQPEDFKHWPPYASLEENCLTNSTLPSIAYGSSACSAKWKIRPQHLWIKDWQPARDCWAQGGRVRKMIGFDASPHEQRRRKGCNTYAVQKEELNRYELLFPLQEWGWDLATCIAEIEDEGLPVPPKSSCYFCTGMKPWEVDALPLFQLRRLVIIEARARTRHLDYAEEKGWPKGEGVPMTEGLWRKAVKGMRGAIPHPGSMTEYIRAKGLLPAVEIDRLIELTPTKPLRKGDIADWQSWINGICEQAGLALAA